MIKWTILLFMLFAQQSVANSPIDDASHNLSEEQETTPVPKAVSRADWMKNVQDNIPDKLCEPNKDFLKCFDITQEECKVISQWFASACLDNMTYQIPEQVDINAGKHWGAVTGHCINTLYFKFMNNKRKEGDNCPPMIQDKATTEPTDNNPVAPPTNSTLLPDPTKPADHE